MKRWLTQSLLAIFIVSIITSYGVLYRSAQALVAENGDGLMIYGENSNTTPRWRTYNGAADSFGAEAGTVVGATPIYSNIKTSPNKQEAIAGYVSSTGALQIMCYNGTSWVNEWTVNVGTANLATTSRFDIAYETNSGDVMVAYSTNVTTTNELAYRTKPGSSGCGTAQWAAAINLNVTRTTGIVARLRLEGSPVASSNSIAMAWSGTANDLSAMIWTGTSWAVGEPTTPLETDLERASVAGDVPSFDLTFESLSGNLMVAWGPSDILAACTIGTNCTRYVRYTTSWSAITPLPTVADDATNLDLSANPLGNEIVLGSMGDREADLSTAYWSGSAWTGFSNRDTDSTAPIGGTKLVSVGWLTGGGFTFSIVAYADGTAPSTNISFQLGDGASFAHGSDFVPTPTPAAFRWLDVQVDRSTKDRLMVTFSDANADVFAKRLLLTNTPSLVWSNADGGAALEASATQATNHSFMFAYWRYAPGTLTTDIVDAIGSSVTTPSLSMSSTSTSSDCQTTTGTFGTSGQRIRARNTTATPGWTVSMAATGGVGAAWSSGTANYDYNDSAGTPAGCSDGGDADVHAGQLTVNPTTSTITPQAGCSTSGISTGSASAFVQGSIDSITLATASGSTQTNCYWEITGIGLSQKVPPFTPAGNYSINVTITTTAN